MKKIVLGLLLLLLTGCQPSSPIEAFDISENCPHVCWLGINPGTTTATNAIKILNKSSHIEQKSITGDEKTGIQAEWYAVRNFSNSIGISFKDDIVTQIYVSNVYPLSMGDLVKYLGEPDGISVKLNIVADAVYVDYILFYSLRQSAILAFTINNNGPDPADKIDWIVLATDLSKSNWLGDSYADRQPWLGFGHLKEYFPGQDIPNLGSWAPGPVSP